MVRLVWLRKDTGHSEEVRQHLMTVGLLSGVARGIDELDEPAVPVGGPGDVGLGVKLGAVDCCPAVTLPLRISAPIFARVSHAGVTSV
jgi:hypothetical protein